MKIKLHKIVHAGPVPQETVITQRRGIVSRGVKIYQHRDITIAGDWVRTGHWQEYNRQEIGRGRKNA